MVWSIHTPDLWIGNAYIIIIIIIILSMIIISNNNILVLQSPGDVQGVGGAGRRGD